jgi:hypothetical protein
MNWFLVKLRDRLRDSAGAGIALVALAMVALLSAVALAVDVGMLVTARTEAATLADASALAGAGVLRDLQGDSAAAHAAAIDWAANNTVRGETVPVLDEDVDVIPDEWTVRVRVHRTEARGNAVPTFFARVFGVDQVDITARAAAWAAPATSSGGDPTQACLLPLALVDEFTDVNENGVFDEGVDFYDPEGGYDEDDHGKLIKLKIHNNDPNTGPPDCQTDDDLDSEVSNEIDYCQDGGDSESWRCWWREDPPADGGGGGTGVLGPRIYPADECGPEMNYRDTVWAASASGNKQSLVTNDDDDNHFEALIRSDPNLEWCDDCAGIDRGCVVDGSIDDRACVPPGYSPRMRSSPVVNPTIDGGGSNTFSVIEDFIGIFVEQVSCAYDAGPFGGPEGRWNVYVRLMVTGGSGSSGDSGSSEASLLRNLQLIE